MVQCITMNEMDSLPSLQMLLPDVQDAICETFQNAECSVEISPDLTEPPFNFPFHALGKKKYLLPSGSIAPKDFFHISSTLEGVIVTDGLAGDCLHLVLEGGNDWRTPLQRIFNEKLSAAWCFLVMELRCGVTHFHVLHSQTKPINTYTEITVLWLSELEDATTTTLLPLPSPPKPKLTKKVVKKSAVDKSNAATEKDGKTIAKTAKSSVAQKAVRKKVATSITATTATASASTISALDDGIENISTANKKALSLRAQNSLTTNVSSDGDNLTNNSDGSGDSGISVVDSDTEKSLVDKRDNVDKNGNERIQSSITDSTISEFVRTQKTPNPFQSKAFVTTGECMKMIGVNGDTSNNTTDGTTAEMFKSFSLNLNNDNDRLPCGKMDQIMEEEEKQISDCGERVNPNLNNNHNSLSNCNTNENDQLIQKRSCPPIGINSIDTNDIVSNGSGNFQRLPSNNKISTGRFANEEIPPVQVLQLVLKQFAYKELGELRVVHPHWDELCGQMLNSAYYEVTDKANNLLKECQRRVKSEPDLHDLLAILTNVQVNILNPVDILRPAMDEGVCCFPYGKLLDELFDIMKKAQRAIQNKENVLINWKPIAEMARRAQMHYKFNLELLMEEKLGEVIRLKALQSIQRIDSYMIDSTVNKLEKAAHLARDELEWEIEQLKHQNAQLKRDNRELRKDCMRLEARVEIIENKFKTMARLLQ